MKISHYCVKNSSTSFLGITGGAIGALSDFAKTGEGIATFSGLMVFIVMTIIIFSVRRKKPMK